MDSKEIRIVWTDWDVANRIGSTIYLNKNLQKPEYRVLLDWIMAHELAHGEHTDKYNWNDFKLDFMPENKMLWQLLLFQLKHPKSWSQLLPFKEVDGGIYWDISLLIQWVIALLIIAFFYFI